MPVLFTTQDRALAERNIINQMRTSKDTIPERGTNSPQLSPQIVLPCAYQKRPPLHWARKVQLRPISVPERIKCVARGQQHLKELLGGSRHRSCRRLTRRRRWRGTSDTGKTPSQKLP